MTHTTQSEAAAETRALWNRYLSVNYQVQVYLDSQEWHDSAYCVGRVTRLLREQKIILDELLGGKQ